MRAIVKGKEQPGNWLAAWIFWLFRMRFRLLQGIFTYQARQFSALFLDRPAQIA
jgi:hypothetical protein